MDTRATVVRSPRQACVCADVALERAHRNPASAPPPWGRSGGRNRGIRLANGAALGYIWHRHGTRMGVDPASTRLRSPESEAPGWGQPEAAKSRGGSEPPGRM